MPRPFPDSDGPLTHVLLLEGADDYHLMGHLRSRHGLDGVFSRRDGKGVQNILQTLPVLLEGSGLKCLGIIVDADTDVSARWAALRNKLVGSGYSNVPIIPTITGTILQQEDMPTVGIWIMPDNQIPGMIEDFVAMLIPEGDRLWGRAEQVVEAIPEEDRLFGIHVMKAKIHTWLAWQQEPGTPMGQAISKRYLRADAPQALLLVDWLRRLFDAQLTADTVEET